MNEEPRRTLLGFLRTTFARGLVVLVPVVITLWVLNILFNAVDGTTSWVFDHYLGRHIPGLGFLTMIVLILLVGGLSRNLFGRTLFRYFERFLGALPVARTIYSAMKEIFNAFQLGGKGKSFRQVVLVEYPRQGVFTVGFVTNEMSVHEGGSETRMVSVFIPNPPNPTSGLMLLIPLKDLQVLALSVEEGLKLVFSGGIVSSGSLTIRER